MQILVEWIKKFKFFLSISMKFNQFQQRFNGNDIQMIELN